MNIESLLTKDEDHLKKKIKETKESKTLLENLGENVTELKKEIQMYNDALEYKKLKKKMKILRNPEKFRVIKYELGDSLELRKNKVKRVSKILDELQDINRDFLRPLADKQDDPRGSLMWTDMEKNDDKVDELVSIIDNLKSRKVYSGSKKTKRKKKSSKKNKFKKKKSSRKKNSSRKKKSSRKKNSSKKRKEI